MIPSASVLRNRKATLCAQMLTETIYQFAKAEDEESLRILDDVIILFVHANPDGNDLVRTWTRGCCASGSTC